MIMSHLLIRLPEDDPKEHERHFCAKRTCQDNFSPRNTVKPRKEEPRKLRTNRLFLKILYPLVKNQCQGVLE